MKTTKFALAVALGVITLVAAPAYGDTITNYTINFTLTSGSPAPLSGSFTYDSTTPKFTNFLVTWFGVVYDLTSSANAPNTSASGCTGEAATPAYGFMLMSEALSGCTPNYEWFASFSRRTPPVFTFSENNSSKVNVDSIQGFGGGTPLGSSATATGTWSLSPTPVPEPSSLLLLGTGILGLMGMGLYKKRLV